MQPMNAFLTITGIETLSLRMERHCANTLKVAEWLERHPQVSWVSYAGLRFEPFPRPGAEVPWQGRTGAVLTFGVKGGYAAGMKVVESVELFSHLANIGDTRSLIIHPASTTHRQLTPEQTRRTAGTQALRWSVSRWGSKRSTTSSPISSRR